VHLGVQREETWIHLEMYPGSAAGDHQPRLVGSDDEVKVSAKPTGLPIRFIRHRR
jgi:hypothetical protein